ncbi:MAG: hypothetical protein IT377_00080 [Polyangiaceae bacterium]|nr:hypothetical protein [Polyangiaceae bacterium]
MHNTLIVVGVLLLMVFVGAGFYSVGFDRGREAAESRAHRCAGLGRGNPANQQPAWFEDCLRQADAP